MEPYKIEYFGIEKLYLNNLKTLEEWKTFWKRYPHIFFPDSLEKDGSNIDLFMGFHEKTVFLNDILFVLEKEWSNRSGKYKLMQEDFDMDASEVYDSNDRKNQSSISTLKTGNEQFIKTQDLADRYFAFETIENYVKEFEKFSNHFFSSRLFIFFEEIIKKIGYNTTFTKSYKDRGPEFDEKLSKIKKDFHYLPTFRKIALIIDINCRNTYLSSVENFFKDKRFTQFNRQRNAIVHPDLVSKNQPLSNSDCFFLIKETIEFFWNNKKIMEQIKKCGEQNITKLS